MKVAWCEKCWTHKHLQQYQVFLDHFLSLVLLSVVTGRTGLYLFLVKLVEYVEFIGGINATTSFSPAC